MFYLKSRKLYYNDKCKAYASHRGSRWHFHLHAEAELKLDWTFKFGCTSAREREYSLRWLSSMCWFNLGSKQLPLFCTKRGLNSLASTSAVFPSLPVPVYSLSLSRSLAKAINLHSMQFARSQRLAKTQLLVYASGDPERTSSYRARKSAMWACYASVCVPCSNWRYSMAWHRNLY